MLLTQLFDRKRLQETWLRRRADVGAMGFIVAFFVCFFGWLVLDGKFTVASDAFNYSFPMRTVAWQMMRSGTLPLWTPHILSGFPILPMQQLALGYPLTWGYLFLPNVWAEQIYLLAPFILGPAFTYAYLRELHRSRTASLLGGLVFTYGGLMIGVLGLYGFTSNSIIWMPLFLLTIERSRHRRFVPCLLLGTASFALSLLNGYVQASAYVAVLGLCYATYVSVVFPPEDRANDRNRWLNWDRWRPLAVAIMSFAFAFGIAAFQLLETMRAVRLSTRIYLQEDLFQSRTPALLSYLFGSLLAPVHYWEIPTYVSPLALVLAVLAGIKIGPRNRHVIFWVGASFVVWLLLSASTPLTTLFNQLPVFRSFQNPLRHSFEWAFAAGVLSAFGLDYLREKTLDHTRSNQSFIVMATTVLCVIALAIAILWWRHATAAPPNAGITLLGVFESAYVRWKLGFLLITSAAVYVGLKIMNATTRRVLLLSIIALSCFVEAHISVWQWWRPFAEPASRYKTAGAATQFLQTFPSESNRVYTRVKLFVEELTLTPRLDPPNVTALYNLHNVAGAEPLISARYSRALGGVLFDAVSPRRGAEPNFKLFGPRSQVLDLLNTKFVVSYAGLATSPESLVTKNGVKYEKVNVELLAGTSATFHGLAGPADEILIVTHLSRGADVKQDTEVARVRIVAKNGETFVRSLRAGVDTAEWAHDRADVRQSVPHQLAPIFESFPGDAAASFEGHLYLARLKLDRIFEVDRVEVNNVANTAALNLVAITLLNSTQQLSTPMPMIDPTRWQAVYNHDDVLILRNNRALPRAWLVGEAQAVDGEEALRRISGDSVHEFDARRTALLEVKTEELPALPGGIVSDDSYARIVQYEPTRLSIETDAPTATILVLSEIFYPGWEAMIDGRPAQIYPTNFVLRSVALPAGRHVVQMHYAAPPARTGLGIGIATLLVISGLLIYDRRRLRLKE